MGVPTCSEQAADTKNVIAKPSNTSILVTIILDALFHLILAYSVFLKVLVTSVLLLLFQPNESYRPLSLGSKTSLRASPKTLNPNTAKLKAIPGYIIT